MAPTWQQLRPYCFVLDTFVRGTAPPPKETMRVSRTCAAVATRWPGGRCDSPGRQWTGDVVVIGECSGSADLAFMARLLDGLAQSGRTILYLSTSRHESRYLRGQANELDWRSRVTIRSLPVISCLVQFWTHPHAYGQLVQDWDALTPVLQTARAWVWRDALRLLQQVALAKTIWQTLRSHIICRTFITRTIYHPFSAVVLADQEATDCLTVSFQHSIVTCPASFIPLSSKRFVSFGITSRALLNTLDERFAAPTRRPRVCQDIMAAGALVDTILPRMPRAAGGPILIIDSGDGFAPRFFGAGEQFAVLEAVVRTLAQQAVGGHRVVVRAHPRGGAGRWRRLARTLPGNVEISTGRPLADDLVVASLVIGLFSTVLPVAAASGLPILILWKPGWFFTPDLAQFVPNHFVTPEALPERLRELSTDGVRYEQACQSALAAAAQYFSGLRRCEFEPELIEALLAPL